MPNYAKVRYHDIYPGVDLIYYGNQGQLEYDFLVAPGTSPRAITLDVEPGLVPTGRQRSGYVLPRIDRNGDLVLELNGGEIRFHEPVAYQNVAVSSSQSKIQNRQFVAARYVLKSKNQVGIRLGSYDATQPLVIDPVVWYSSYLGGSSRDQASGILSTARQCVRQALPLGRLYPRVRHGFGPAAELQGNELRCFRDKIDASGKKPGLFHLPGWQL